MSADSGDKTGKGGLGLVIQGVSSQSNKEEDKALKKKRALVRGEIIASETVYVKHLEVIFKTFLEPLRDKCKDPAFRVTPEQCKAIFSNLESLLGFHKMFLADLTANEHPDVAKVFLQYADFLKMYTDYVNSYSNAVTIMSNLRDNTDFNKWLQKTQKGAELDLISYLIMPVQRIPRYVLLLREMKKHTPETHKGYDNLLLCLSKLEDIADRINESKRRAEAARDLLKIQSRLTGDVPPLLLPYRFLVLEGKLKIMGTGVFGTAKAKSHYFFLFNDILLWTTKPPENRFKGSMELSAAKLEAENPDASDRFQISDASECLLFVCPDPALRKKWVDALGEQIAASVDKRNRQRETRETVRERAGLRTKGHDMHAMMKGSLFEIRQRASSTVNGRPPPESTEPSVVELADDDAYARGDFLGGGGELKDPSSRELSRTENGGSPRSESEGGNTTTKSNGTTSSAGGGGGDRKGKSQPNRGLHMGLFQPPSEPAKSPPPGKPS